MRRPDTVYCRCGLCQDRGHEADEIGSLAASKKGAGPAERQNGIDRTIDLLEALLHLRAPSKLSDLTKQMGAPRSTVYAIANRLIEADLLESVGDGGQVYFGKAGIST